MRHPGLTARVGLIAALALAGCGGADEAAGPRLSSRAAVQGAGFTSVNEAVDGAGHCANGNPETNCNLYDGKAYVWMNGGPVSQVMGDGTYFFAVLAPSGQASPVDGADGNLSDLPGGDALANRTFTISGGVLSYGGTHDLANGKIRLFPYDDTPNPGGVYVLALCALEDGAEVRASDCKFDAFKISAGTPTQPPRVAVTGAKYYDANANGRRDEGEVGIGGWVIEWTGGAGGAVATAADGTFQLDVSTPALLAVAERQPDAPTTWMQTGNLEDQSSAAPQSTVELADKAYTVFLDGGDVSGVLFGNLCLGAGGGKTLGFWHNRNGQALVDAPDLAMLAALHLVNADGTGYDPTTKEALSTWLTSATATNMARMLSTQLAAASLNVFNGLVQGGALVHAPGTGSANAAGFAAMSAILAEADASLAAHPLTVDAGEARTRQEALKNALDRANNNLNFVQPGPASCPAAVFTLPAP